MKNLYGLLAMAAMFGGELYNVDDKRKNCKRGDFQTIEDKENLNSKKCMNPKCNNNRSYKKLYCSAECCKEHRQILKSKT